MPRSALEGSILSGETRSWRGPNGFRFICSGGSAPCSRLFLPHVSTAARNAVEQLVEKEVERQVKQLRQQDAFVMSLDSSIYLRMPSSIK